MVPQAPQIFEKPRNAVLRMQRVQDNNFWELGSGFVTPLVSTCLHMLVFVCDTICSTSVAYGVHYGGKQVQELTPYLILLT